MHWLYKVGCVCAHVRVRSRSRRHRETNLQPNTAASFTKAQLGLHGFESLDTALDIIDGVATIDVAAIHRGVDLSWTVLDLSGVGVKLRIIISHW